MKYSLLTTLAIVLAAGCTQLQSQTAPDNTPAALKTDVNGNKLGFFSRPVMLYDDGNTAVHFYGLVEATLGYATNQTDHGNTTFGFQTSWFSGNRYGFDMDHALAFGDQMGLPGLKVISKLEGEFESQNGSFDTNNGIFNRDCWIGLYSEDLGKLTFGRQNTLTRDFTQTWGDAYGTQDVTLKEGGFSNVNNFKQFIFYSAAPGGTRSDSAIVWKKKVGAHVVLGLGYGFSYQGAGGSADPGVGGAIPGKQGIGSSQEASFAYNQLAIGSGKLSFNANYNRGNKSDPTETFSLVHQAELIGGDFVIGNFKVNGGYVHYTAEQGRDNSAGTRTDNSWTVSGSVKADRTEFALGYVKMAGKHAGVNGAGKVINPFLGDTSGVTTVVDGNKGTIFGSIMYHADVNTDFYIAADSMKVGGDWAVGDAQGNESAYGKGQKYDSELELALGIRFKF
jgi:predicted porin